MVVESKKRKVRTVVDFGFLDGCTVCRVRTVNADGGSSVRNLNAEKSVKTLLETALGERITDRPFRKMASFWIEPRRISGSVGKEEGTMWAEYRIYPSCISVVSEIAMEIYSTIINSCKKKRRGRERGRAVKKDVIITGDLFCGAGGTSTGMEEMT